MNLKSVILLSRPQQWVKNAFVFLPLFFHGKFGDVHLLLSCFVTFFAFSFAAGSIYCFNDICDAKSDRIHPEKCNRPIASGVISIKQAYFVMLIYLAISLSIFFFFGGETKYKLITLIAFYCVMNVAYCVKLKQYAIVDVMIISVGFVLRVLSGGVATGIILSEWIVLMTFLLSLFLAFSKRRDDVVIYQNSGILTREHTKRYNLEFLNQVMTVISTVTIIAYIMYTLSPDVTERFHNRYVYLTSIFVLSGIIRYLQLTIIDLKSGDPVKILIRDRFIQCCIVGWIISFIFIIYIK